LLQVHKGHASAREFFTPANAGSYDSVVRAATFGQDAAWKRRILEVVADRNNVLELACGTGILSSMLMAGGGRRVAGIDLTVEYILQASRRKLHIPLAQGTAEMLPYRDGSFDAVVSSYLAKYVDMESVADECWRVLQPGSVAVFHDFTYPDGAMRSLWSLYFTILRIAGVFAGSWKAVFDQLDGVIRQSEWVSEAQEALRSRGFQNVACRHYTAGTAAIVFAEKPHDCHK
jgi:demethylmenaquinone methyltransferase / 2-methoxy-6-polyprenyl-1,4-benzoquinol methylase